MGSVRAISQLYAMAPENTMSFSRPNPAEKNVLPHWAAGRVNSGHSTTASQHHSTMAAGQQAAWLAKSLGKVFNNVIHMLNANGEPDRIGQNARFGQFCLGEL